MAPTVPQGRGGRHFVADSQATNYGAVPSFRQILGTESLWDFISVWNPSCDISRRGQIWQMRRSCLVLNPLPFRLFLFSSILSPFASYICGHVSSFASADSTWASNYSTSPLIQTNFSMRIAPCLWPRWLLSIKAGWTSDELTNHRAYEEIWSRVRWQIVSYISVS